MINVCVRFAFRGARVICVKNLLALISSVLMIIFRKCFASISCGVDKNRAAVVLKTMKAPKVGTAVMGKKLATQCYGSYAKVKKLSGETIASEGSGRGRVTIILVHV